MIESIIPYQSKVLYSVLSGEDIFIISSCVKKSLGKPGCCIVSGESYVIISRTKKERNLC